MTIAPPQDSSVDDLPYLTAVSTTGPASQRTTRIERLNTASARRVIEPDVDVIGSVGDGPVMARDLLSVAGLGLDLTDDQWCRLSREEMASIFDAGVRFESTLMANFGRSLAYRRDLTDPRVTYMLHEVGEETRHSRLFIRVISQLKPTAVNPFTHPAFAVIDKRVTGWALGHDALFMVMVLVGEEGPDLLQKLALDSEGTDPFVREVNRYHRSEEARHLSFGRTVLGELFAKAGRTEKFIIRHLGPAIGGGVFDGLVHPGVYATIGLPPWRTWNAVRKSAPRRELRAQVLRPVRDALVAAGAFRGDRPTRAWRKACSG